MYTIQKYRVTLKNRKTKFTVFLPILPFLPVNFEKFTGKNGKRIFGKMENPRVQRAHQERIGPKNSTIVT